MTNKPINKETIDPKSFNEIDEVTQKKRRKIKKRTDELKDCIELDNLINKECYE